MKLDYNIYKKLVVVKGWRGIFLFSEFDTPRLLHLQDGEESPLERGVSKKRCLES